MISEHSACLNLVFLCVAYDIEEETVDKASVVTSSIDEPDSPSPSSPTKSVDELLQVMGMFKKINSICCLRRALSCNHKTGKSRSWSDERRSNGFSL